LLLVVCASSNKNANRNRCEHNDLLALILLHNPIDELVKH
jgi:hypothetical protein